jgi:hypothetical protein
MIIALGLLVLALCLAISRRTRGLGLGLLGLMAVGFFFLGFSSVRVQRGEVYVPEPVTIERLHQHAADTLQADSLSHERLAAAMDDAVVQVAPDGSRMEVYADGMRVKQTFAGDRLMVRGPGGHTAMSLHGPTSVSYSQSYQMKRWIILWPIALLAVGFAVVRIVRGGSAGRGHAVLAGVGVLALLVMLMLGVRLARNSSHLSAQAPVPPRPPSLIPNVQALVDSQDQVVHAEKQLAESQESLAALWDKLTQPKINLNLDAAKLALESHASKGDQELVAAARLILSKSAPGADPFTQGWLTNAAKAILDASAKASKDKSPEPPETPVQLVTTAAEPVKTEKAPSKEAIAEPAVSNKPRPAWLDDPPKFVGNTSRVVVSTDPYSSLDECYKALRDRMREAVLDRLKEKVLETAGSNPAAYVPPLEQMGISTEYIRRELCPEEPYVETVHASFGPMLKVSALLEFNERQDEFLMDAWKAYARRAGIKNMGALSLLVLSGLGLLYGMLKLDTWTRGYYTKRLFLGVPAVIIAVVAAVAMLG